MGFCVGFSMKKEPLSAFCIGFSMKKEPLSAFCDGFRLEKGPRPRHNDIMSRKPNSNDPSQPQRPETAENHSEDSGGMGNASRKLRYDAPALDIPRPLYLRSGDDPSDEDAA